MGKIAFNKNTLKKERDLLSLYESLLPSLDLKRRQLMIRFERTKKDLNNQKNKLKQHIQTTGQELPMLANSKVDVSDMVEHYKVQTEEKNVLGVKLPKLENISYQIRDYSMLAKPHWVDFYVERLVQALEIRTQITILLEQVRRLDKAVRVITQRVNLFDKILIPTRKKNIHKIRVYLGDMERAAIIQAKIAKSRRKLDLDIIGERH